MAVTVTPEVVIDSTIYSCAADALDWAVIVVDGISIKWGRTDYLDSRTSPASAKISLLDATGQWAQRIRNREILGKPVVIRWRGISRPADQPGTEIVISPVNIFSGRVAAAKIYPTEVFTKGIPSAGYDFPQHIRAWRIDLELSDRTADLGNARVGNEEWPRETMVQRAVRIRDLGLAAGSGISQMYFNPDYAGYNVAPLDAKDKTALDLMNSLYNSIGNDSYAYDPDENVVREYVRLSGTTVIGLATFDSSRGAVLPVPNDITIDGKVYPAVALAGCQLPADTAIALEPDQDINRLECRWKDHSTGHKEHTTVQDGVQAGDSRRVMAWESWLDDGLQIDPTLAAVWDRVTKEGSRPRHPKITIPWNKSFVSERLARWSLQAWGNTRPAYVSGSMPWQWLAGPTADYAPVVAPIGGTTVWDPTKGWQIDLIVHWVHNSGAAAVPATWSSLQQFKAATDAPVPWWWILLGLPIPTVANGDPTPERNLKWGSPDVLDGYEFDQSVTWLDLKHVDQSQTHIKDILQ